MVKLPSVAGLGLMLVATAAHAEPAKSPNADTWIETLGSQGVTNWRTLSGLTAHPRDPHILYAIPDGDGGPRRVLQINVQDRPPQIVGETRLSVCPAPLDLEGIVATRHNSFWLVSEGRAGDDPPNRLLRADAAGRCTHEFRLPPLVAEHVSKRGFEGVAFQDEPAAVYVALQGPTKTDEPGHTRIGKFDLKEREWSFFYYPLEVLKGARVGLSELLYLGDGRFAAIERDNKEGAEAKVKWITTFQLPAKGAPRGSTNVPVVEKTRAVDLVKVFRDAGRPVEEQIEGLAITPTGKVYVLTDNKDAEDTVLIHLGDADDWGLD